MLRKFLPDGVSWKRELAREIGYREAGSFLARAQARYDELLGQAPRLDNRALRNHFENRILPAIAAYSVFLMDADKDTAVSRLDQLLEAGIGPERSMYRFWGRFPLFFDMLRLMLKPMMQAQYTEGWEVEWLDLGRDVVGLNCHACFYLDVLTEYGFPELTQHFCRLDDLLAAEAASSIRFERTQTLGRGGSLCDFRYMRVRRA